MNERTNKNYPWCPGCVPFQALGKKKGYIDEYGHKTLNCTKIAAFVCQNDVLRRAQINLSWFLLIKGWKVDKHYPTDKRKNPWLCNKHEEGGNTTPECMVWASELPKNEDNLSTFGCQETS